jgi:hypothetical protein
MGTVDVRLLVNIFDVCQNFIKDTDVENFSVRTEIVERWFDVLQS